MWQITNPQKLQWVGRVRGVFFFLFFFCFWFVMGFSCFVLGILFLCFGHSEVLFFFCFCFPPFFAFWVLWISMFVLGERNCVCNWVARYVVYNSVFSVLLWNLKAFALSNQLVELCWFGAIFYFFFFFFVSIIYELSLSLSLTMRCVWWIIVHMVSLS